MSAVVAVMQLSNGCDDFINKLDRVKPRFGETLQLPFYGEVPANGCKGRPARSVFDIHISGKLVEAALIASAAGIVDPPTSRQRN